MVKCVLHALQAAADSQAATVAQRNRRREQLLSSIHSRTQARLSSTDQQIAVHTALRDRQVRLQASVLRSACSGLLTCRFAVLEQAIEAHCRYTCSVLQTAGDVSACSTPGSWACPGPAHHIAATNTSAASISGSSAVHAQPLVTSSCACR